MCAATLPQIPRRRSPAPPRRRPRPGGARSVAGAQRRSVARAMCRRHRTGRLLRTPISTAPATCPVNAAATRRRRALERSSGTWTEPTSRTVSKVRRSSSLTPAARLAGEQAVRRTRGSASTAPAANSAPAAPASTVPIIRRDAPGPDSYAARPRLPRTPAARRPRTRTCTTSTISDHGAGSVAATLQMHDQVDRARGLLAHCDVRQRDVCHQRKRLDAPQRVGRGVRVHGRHRPVVPGVESLEHVERLRTAHLADDDPVGAHPQRVAHQLADRDLSPALQIRGPAFEAQHVGLPQPQLRRVLDRDHALAGRDERRQHVEQRRLARARCRR